MTDTAAAAVIADLEDRRWTAMIDKDYDTLRSMFADELAYTHSNGRSDGKDAYLQSLVDLVFDYRGAERTATEIRVLDRTALVTGNVALHVVAGGNDRHFNARYTVVWVQRPSGEWQFLCWQSTPLP